MILSTSYRYYEPRFQDEAFEKIKENGYGACDYPLYVCKSPLDHSDEKPEAERAALCEKHRALAERSGVAIHQTHAGFYTSIDCYDEDYATAYVEHIKKQITMAKWLNARYVVVHPVQPYGWNEDLEPERTRLLNTEILKRLTEHAEKEGVVLALENMPGIFPTVPCTSPEILLSYIQDVDEKHLKICFDAGHANMAKNFRGDGKTVTCGDYVRAFGKRIACLHVHENNGKLDQHNMLGTTPTGAPDWEEIFIALKEIGYQGTFNAEADFSTRLTDPLFCDGERLQEKLFSYYLDKFHLQ